MSVTAHSDLRSMSMPGVLFALLGGGILFAYFKFLHYVRFWGPLTQILIVLAAGACFLIGLGLIRRGLSGEDLTRRRRRSQQHRVLLTREGMACLVIMGVTLIGSLMTATNMLMLVFATIAGPFILNGWIGFSMLKRTRLERRLPRQVMAGEPAAVELVLSNRRWLLSSRMMTVRDQITGEHDRTHASVLFTRVAAGGQRTGRYRVQLMQRGRYRFGPAVVSSRFPLGLVERALVCNVESEMVVYPRIGQLRSRWRHRTQTSPELMQRAAHQRGMFEDEFHRLREFRSGDNPRAIQWRASARRNELIVREYIPQRDQALLVLLDLWEPPAPGEEHRVRTELAASFVATICLDHVRNSRSSDLQVCVCGQQREEWRRFSEPDVEGLLDLLAGIHGGGAAQSATAMSDLMASRPANARVVVVTTRPRPAAALRDWPFPMVGGTRNDVEIYEADADRLSAVFELS